MLRAEAGRGAALDVGRRPCSPGNFDFAISALASQPWPTVVIEQKRFTKSLSWWTCSRVSSPFSSRFKIFDEDYYVIGDQLSLYALYSYSFS